MTKYTITIMTQWVNDNYENDTHEPLVFECDSIFNACAKAYAIYQGNGKAPSPCAKDVFIVQIGESSTPQYIYCKPRGWEELTSEQFLEWKNRTLTLKVLNKHPPFSKFWDGR